MSATLYALVGPAFTPLIALRWRAELWGSDAPRKFKTATAGLNAATTGDNQLHTWQQNGPAEAGPFRSDRSVAAAVMTMMAVMMVASASEGETDARAIVVR